MTLLENKKKEIQKQEEDLEEIQRLRQTLQDLQQEHFKLLQKTNLNPSINDQRIDFIEGDSIKNQLDIFSLEDGSEPSTIKNFDHYMNSFDSYEDEETFKEEYCDACTQLMTI